MIGQDVKPDPESNNAYSVLWAGTIMLMNQVFGLLRRLAAKGTWKVHRDHLAHRDGTRHTRCIGRLRRRLCRDCGRERVDTSWLAILVAFVCSEIRLHLSALRLLVSLLLAVPAFTFELADRFLIFLLALASILGLAFAALTAFVLVLPYSTLIYGSTSRRPPTSCLRGWSISRMKRCKHDRDRAQRNTRWQQPNNVSNTYPQETGTSSTSAGVIDTRTLGKPKSFTGLTAEWTTWQFTFKAFACAAHPKMKDVFDLATRKGSDPVVNSDMTTELQSLSTQLYHMLVMTLSDQALEIVRNSPEGHRCRSVAQVALGARARLLVSDTERCCSHF